MTTLKERIDAAMAAYKKERERQAEQEIAAIKARTKKINEQAAKAEAKKKAEASLKRAKTRLAKTKGKGKKCSTKAKAVTNPWW
jgi:hypothetical protein